MPFNITAPKDDDEYFERMSRAIFQAGLNWKMINNKWPNFRKAFANFSIDKVAKFNEKDVESLMKDTGIIRNGKKIRSTIFNAQEFQRIEKEFGSFKKYIDSFKSAHGGLANDMRERFKHLGPSSSRTYLWMAGVKLEPNEEEKAWIAKHRKAK